MSQYSSITPSVFRRPSIELVAILVVCAIIFAVPTLLNNDYLLNKIAHYLVLGILAMSLSLSWGYAGILNLGQAMSFGLGSYAIRNSTIRTNSAPITSVQVSTKAADSESAPLSMPR